MFRTLLLIGMVLLMSQVARASTLVHGDADFSSLSDWLAVATQTGLDTFSGIAPGGGITTYNTTQGYTDPFSIDFVGAFGSANSLEIVDGLYNSPWYNFGAGASLNTGLSSATVQPYIMAMLPPNVTAISLDVMTYGNVYPVTITASDGTTETVTTVSRQQTFYGFTFAVPITWVEVSIPGSPNFTSVLLDNFCIGADDVTSTPEPATFLLIGIGLIFMACLKKRRHA